MANVRSFSCPACGAPIPPDATRCGYCGRYLPWSPRPTIRRSICKHKTPSRPSIGGYLRDALNLGRTPSPCQYHGAGCSRAESSALTSLTQAPNVQAIEAKIDFTVKQDAQGGIAVRWCLEVKYCDLRHSMVSAMFPPGSSYQGMMVMPLMSAVDFLQHVVFPGRIQPPLT